MTVPCLPVDVWLIIFKYVDATYDLLDDIDADSLTVLWCIVRNVSPHIRDCIDEYFRHGVLQRTLIDLSYSSINYSAGPSFVHLHLPMRFSHLSSDGTRAVFRQMAYRTSGSSHTNRGCIRGWLPFAERYSSETHRPKPQVERGRWISNFQGMTPAWEREHLKLRNTLVGEEKINYLASLRDHTSIGRGYRPPYYFKIREAVNDTELVGLAVNIEKREISFDWRCTFTSFFVEQRFVMLAESGLSKQRTYDRDLVVAASRVQASMHMHDHWNSNSRRARRKRLQSWVAVNKDRMTPEDRLQAEDRVERTKQQVRRNLRVDNLRDLITVDFAWELKEMVPNRCAEDLPYLLQWPWIQDDMYTTPRKPVQLRCGPRGCCTM